MMKFIIFNNYLRKFYNSSKLTERIAQGIQCTRISDKIMNTKLEEVGSNKISLKWISRR